MEIYIFIVFGPVMTVNGCFSFYCRARNENVCINCVWCVCRQAVIGERCRQAVRVRHPLTATQEWRPQGPHLLTDDAHDWPAGGNIPSHSTRGWDLAMWSERCVGVSNVPSHSAKGGTWPCGQSGALACLTYPVIALGGGATWPHVVRAMRWRVQGDRFEPQRWHWVHLSFWHTIVRVSTVRDSNMWAPINRLYACIAMSAYTSL
jgi:hypothetical protein